MSTRSHIGFIKGHQITYIYCHSDGYPEYNGHMLQKYYTDKEKVENLVNLGDISVLKENLTPKEGEEHSFDGPRADGVVVAYHRDRGEDWERVKPVAFQIENFKDIWETDFIAGGMIEYSYLYNMNDEVFGEIQPGKWGLMFKNLRDKPIYKDLETEYKKNNGWE